MANTGMVELGEVQLATYLFEKTFTGQPSFQNGLPSLIAFPFGCNTANCLIRTFSQGIGLAVVERNMVLYLGSNRQVGSYIPLITIHQGRPLVVAPLLRTSLFFAT
ncbi:unnamed protein product [Camellia sinensis]